MGLFPDVLVTHAVFLSSSSGAHLCRNLHSDRASKAVGCPGVGLLTLGLPTQNHQGRWLKLHGRNDAVLLKCCVNSRVLSFSCVSTALSLDSSSPPVVHIKISACSVSGFHDVIRSPSPLGQSENGSPLLLQRTSLKSKLLERQHGEEHTSACVGMG